MEREKSETTTNSIERGRGSTAGTPKLVDPNHNREVIFALPSLQLHLKTEHLQTAIPPDPLSNAGFVFRANNLFNTLFLQMKGKKLIVVL